MFKFKDLSARLRPFDYARGFGDFRTHYNLGYTLVGVPQGAPVAAILPPQLNSQS